MKTQLILFDIPIIVSDEAVKIDEWCIEVYNGQSLAPKETPRFTDEMGNTWWLRQMNMNCQANYPECKKVIAGLPKFPSIDFNGFEEQLGIIDVNKLAKEKCKEIDDFGFSEKGFIEGFKTAQKLNEKKFSLEDIKKAFKEGLSYTTTKHYHDYSEDLFINSLSQPKVFDIEVEMEQYTQNYHKDIWYDRPKITNNSIKIIKVL